MLEFQWDLYKIAFGAVLGFFFSLLGVWAQRKMDRNERTREAQQQRRALAVALSVEIGAFIDGFFREVSEALEAIASPIGSNLKPLKVFAPVALPLYAGNASRIGQFSSVTSRAVAEFYGLAETFGRTLEILNESHTWEVEQNRRVEEHADCAKQFHKLKGMLPKIKAAADTALTVLSKE